MKHSLLTMMAFAIGSMAYGQCKPSGLYLFNGDANESGGYGKNGVVVGATLSQNRFGTANSAYYFDGVDDHIYVPDDSSNDLSTTFTIMAWVKPDNGYGSFKDNHVSVVDKWGNAGSQLAAYCLNIHSNGEVEGFTHTGSAGTYKWSNSSISTGAWTHIAIVRKSDDSVRIYINGVLDNTYKTVTPQNSGFDLTFGMAADPSIQSAYPDKYRFKGTIDDVKIYKCALTPSQLMSNEDISFFSKQWEVLPNPGTDIFRINSNLEGDYSVQICNMNGQVIYDARNPETIDLSEMPSGIFFVTLTDLNSGMTSSKKLLIQ